MKTLKPTWDDNDVILSTVVNAAMLEVYYVSSVALYNSCMAANRSV